MASSSGAFSRAASRLFAHFGEEAVFRGGATPIRAVLTRNVELIGDAGHVERVVTTATLQATLKPHRGDTLVIGAESWTLDSPLHGDGDVTVWVLLPSA